MDGTLWVDVGAFAQDGGIALTALIVNLSDTTLIPLKPLGRIIATGNITTTTCYVCMDR